MRKTTILTLLFLAVSLLTIKCSKNSGNAAPDYNGTWTGTTSQGKALSYTVAGNKVTSITIAYSLTGNCSPSPTGASVTLSDGNAISGTSFSIAGGTALTGTFSSGNASSGTFTISFTGNPPGCSSVASGTWSATK